MTVRLLRWWSWLVLVVVLALGSLPPITEADGVDAEPNNNFSTAELIYFRGYNGQEKVTGAVGYVQVYVFREVGPEDDLVPVEERRAATHYYVDILDVSGRGVDVVELERGTEVNDWAFGSPVTIDQEGNIYQLIMTIRGGWGDPLDTMRVTRYSRTGGRPAGIPCPPSKAVGKSWRFRFRGRFPPSSPRQPNQLPPPPSRRPHPIK